MGGRNSPIVSGQAHEEGLPQSEREKKALRRPSVSFAARSNTGERGLITRAL